VVLDRFGLGGDLAELVRHIWVGRWAVPDGEVRPQRVDDRGRLVNEACRLAEEDPVLTRAADLAARLGLSPRSLERLVRSHIGMAPKWLIECRRLQEAATTLFGS
jgi:methylphosphotriester-DNA--protein-cysteine methyltransferase